MSDGNWTRYGGAAGVAAVVLFVSGALVDGSGPPFDAPAAELAAHVDEKRTRIQVASGLLALTGPLLVWFLASIATRARERGQGARRAGLVAFGCGLAFVTMFLVDITFMAVMALRPENMLDEPELAAALQDMELLLMGTAAPLASGLLVACAVLVLRERAVWPAWVGRLAAIAAPLYLLRMGTLFTTDGPFAADGLLGIYVPVAALAGWLLIAGLVLATRETAAR